MAIKSISDLHDVIVSQYGRFISAVLKAAEIDLQAQVYLSIVLPAPFVNMEGRKLRNINWLCQDYKTLEWQSQYVVSSPKLFRVPHNIASGSALPG